MGAKRPLPDHRGSTVLRVGILAKGCPSFPTDFSESGFIFSDDLGVSQLVFPQRAICLEIVSEYVYLLGK